MHFGSLDGPDTIDACAKAALAHSANAAIAAPRSTWIRESMLSPFVEGVPSKRNDGPVVQVPV